MSAAQWQAWAKQHARAHLRQLLADVPGVRATILASGDGYELAAAGDEGLAQAQLAGMSSTMHGLGEAMARQSGLDHCRDVIVDGDAGRIVLMSVPVASPQLVLMTIVEGQSAFGQLLLECRRCCVAIGKELDGSGDLVGGRSAANR